MQTKAMNVGARDNNLNRSRTGNVEGQRVGTGIEGLFEALFFFFFFGSILRERAGMDILMRKKALMK